MGCEGMNELICTLVDGEATPDEENKLREHMVSCPECRSLFEAFSAFSYGFASMRTEPPELLSKGIMYKIALETSQNRRRFGSWGRFTGFAAGLLIIIAIGVSLPKYIGGLGSQSASGSARSSEENGLMYMTADAADKAAEESLSGDADMAPESDVAGNPAPEDVPDNTISAEEYNADDGTYLGAPPNVTEPLQKVIEELQDEIDKYSVIYLYKSDGKNNPASISQIDPIRQENAETWYALTLADIDKNDEFNDTYYTGADSEAVLIVVISE